ncbi:MAG: aspartate--tRNA(Asn) ligase [Tenericutes bacterium]|nr:aspartate--tRNA(Asn) ligase [Mycoplasmatota bacterium]
MINFKENIDKEVTISGFAEKVRNLQWVQFIVLRAEGKRIQITIEKSEEKNKEMVEIVNNLTNESTIKVTGVIKENEKVKMGGMELIPSSIEVTSLSAPELPISITNKDAAQIDTRMDNRFIDLRNDVNFYIFKIQTEFVKALRNYLYKKDFTEIHTPKLIGAASESGSEVFEVEYFGDKAYLAQSPQFYKQMAIAAGYEKVFEVAPCFRAENSNTNRHATEFTSFDIEFANINSYQDVMDLEEDLLIEGLKAVKEKYGDLIKEKYNVDVVIPTKPFPRIKLEDLYEKLHEKYGYEIPDHDVGDMNAETEKLTSKFAMEEYGHEFIFVTDFSKTKRAFYHMRKDDVPQGYDLIWKGTEITTGAQREHRYDVLEKQASEKGLGEDIKFYKDFFKYGCPPHGGFALGIDRITMLLLNLPSLKETMFIFRGPNRITP